MNEFFFFDQNNKNILEEKYNNDHEFKKLHPSSTFDFWIITGHFRKYGFEQCRYCGVICESKKKVCSCAFSEIAITEHFENHFQKKEKISLDNLRFLCNLIGKATRHIQRSVETTNNEEILEVCEMLSEMIDRKHYKGFTISQKAVVEIYKEQKRYHWYWGAMCYTPGHKQLWIHIGKDREKAKTKIDAWLAKPSNLKKLSPLHLEKIKKHEEKIEM